MLHHFRKRLSITIFLAIFIFTAVAADAQDPSTEGRAGSADISPRALSSTFATVTKMVESAVVSIDTKGKMPEVTTRGGAQPSDPEDLREFFNRVIPRRPAYSVGSGFIIDKRGFIVTNAHVVANAARINVKLHSGEELTAIIVGQDEETDIAVLRVDAGRELPVVKIGNSDAAQVGDWVLAIGSPFGLNRTVTAGIISQVQRATPSATVFQKFIQTDAAINRGNSGGPLVNMDGEVIGVNSQIATTNGDFNGVGFALPSRDAGFVIDQIMKDGKVRRGYLGVSLESVKQEFAKVYGMTEPKGAIVIDVRDPKSGAGIAGLKAGDVIVEFDGKPVENAQDLIAKVASTLPDREVVVSYLRESGSNVENKKASIRLGERPGQQANFADRADNVRIPLGRDRVDPKPFGLTLAPVTADVAELYGPEAKNALVIKQIDPESYIADVKVSTGADALAEGDLIVRINRQPVGDMRSFSDIVKKLKTGDAVVLHVLTYNPRTKLSQLKIVQFTLQLD